MRTSFILVVLVATLACLVTATPHRRHFHWFRRVKHRPHTSPSGTELPVAATVFETITTEVLSQATPLPEGQSDTNDFFSTIEQSTSIPTETPTASPATTEVPATASQSTDAPQTPLPTPTETTTTTTELPSASTPPQSSPTSSPGDGQSLAYSGEGTYYTANSGQGGACEIVNDNPDVVAMNAPDYDGKCGKCVLIKGERGSAKAKVVDKCPGCASGDLDLSEELFPKIADPLKGRVKISWSIVEC